MPIVNAKEMLLTATAEKYAVGAFNVTNFIQMKAVVETLLKWVGRNPEKVQLQSIILMELIFLVLQQLY